MNGKIASRENNSVAQKWCIKLKRYANIKKASQDEQQNQTTTTNINYIKKLYVRFKKQNLLTMSK